MARCDVSHVLRFPIVVAIVVATGATGVASAQEARLRERQAIVVPHEVLVELQRLAREVFGEEAFRDLSRELSREIGRAIAWLAREHD